MEVRLTWFEAFQAASVGVMRQIEALKLGRADNHGFAGDGWGAHIEGAGAEMAAAKFTGRYWESVVRRPESLDGDVGSGLQVRSTDRPNGCLILHPTDPDEAVFALLVGRIPMFRFAGALLGGDGKREEFWREDTGRPAFFVPQEALADSLAGVVEASASDLSISF